MTVSESIVITTEEITSQLLVEAAALYSTEIFKTHIWSWQFKPRFGERSKAIIARYNGKLIGFNATMPIRIVVDKAQIAPAIWSCDFIVDKAFRGQGVGSQIKDEMLSHFGRPIMSLGVSDSAYPLLLKKGWKSPGQLEILQLVIRPESAKQLLLKSWGGVNFLRYGITASISAEKYSCYSSVELPDKSLIDLLLQQQVIPQGCATILRDHEYLTWRYQEYPFAAYHFAIVLDSGAQAKVLLVYRFSADKCIEICDALGVLDSAGVIAAALKYFKQQYAQLRLITWSTSLEVLKINLLANGFILKRYSTRFVVHDNRQQLESAHWILNSGDSDGDFLRIAKDCFISRDNGNFSPSVESRQHQAAYARVYGTVLYQSQDGYDFSCLGADEFYRVAAEWNELLEQSGTNKLFLNWHWMSCWWKEWSDLLRLHLSIYFIYHRGQLVGILPFYTYKKGFINYYQFIGNAWGVAPTVRSEYMGPIFHKSHLAALSKVTVRFLKKFPKSSIFVVPDSTVPELFPLNHLVRKVDAGYYLKTTGSLQEYENTLGKMTRLKAFNRRDYLLAHYQSVKIYDFSINEDALTSFFSLLNGFHYVRWGKACFNENAVNFHKRLLLTSKEMIPKLSCLEINGEIVSASYNLIVGRRFYNIQSGYLEHFDKKISLGTLHMGWMIESCFNDNSIDEFDFLAGTGKTEDYKSHYKGVRVNYYTVQYFASRFLCNLFVIARLLKSLSPLRWLQHSKTVSGK